MYHSVWGGPVAGSGRKYGSEVEIAVAKEHSRNEGTVEGCTAVFEPRAAAQRPLSLSWREAALLRIANSSCVVADDCEQLRG